MLKTYSIPMTNFMLKTFSDPMTKSHTQNLFHSNGKMLNPIPFQQN